jgi:hypothetical protein
VLKKVKNVHCDKKACFWVSITGYVLQRDGCHGNMTYFSIQMCRHHVLNVKMWFYVSHCPVMRSTVTVLRCSGIMCHSTHMCRRHVSEHSCAGIMCHSTHMCRHHVSEHSDVPASCVIVPTFAGVMCQSTQMCRHHVS